MTEGPRAPMEREQTRRSGNGIPDVFRQRNLSSGVERSFPTGVAISLTFSSYL